MCKGVVFLLEVIRVYENGAGPGLVAPGFCERDGEVVFKQCTIGQTGKRVMQFLVGELRQEFAFLGYVTD